MFFSSGFPRKLLIHITCLLTAIHTRWLCITSHRLTASKIINLSFGGSVVLLHTGPVTFCCKTEIIYDSRKKKIFRSQVLLLIFPNEKNISARFLQFYFWTAQLNNPFSNTRITIPGELLSFFTPVFTWLCISINLF